MSEKATSSSAATWMVAILAVPLVYFATAVIYAVIYRRSAHPPTRPEWVDWLYWPITWAYTHSRDFHDAWEGLMEMLGAPLK